MKFRDVVSVLIIALVSFACGKKDAPTDTKSASATQEAKAAASSREGNGQPPADDDLTEEDDEDEMGHDEGKEDVE